MPSDRPSVQHPPRRAPEERRTLLGLVAVMGGCVVLVIGLRMLSGPASASAQQIGAGQTRYRDLESLMKEGVNERASSLSYIIWHGGELDEADFQEVESTARAIAEITRQMPDLAHAKWTAEDLDLFGRHRARLSGSARSMVLAAGRRDAEEVTRLMGDLESSCTDCHARLAPHLDRRDRP